MPTYTYTGTGGMGQGGEVSQTVKFSEKVICGVVQGGKARQVVSFLNKAVGGVQQGGFPAVWVSAPPKKTTVAYVAPLFCTDEHIALRAVTDFKVLVPKSQMIAYGTNGVSPVDSPWTLISETVNFEEQGVLPGMVVILTKPAAIFRGSGSLYAVSEISPPIGNTLTVRTLGQPEGVGQPINVPWAVSDLVAIEFTIATFLPQVENVTYDLMQRFNLDPNYSGTTTANIYDRRVLRQATVLTVLLQAYTLESRTPNSDFSAKVMLIGEEKREVMDRVVIRWGKLGQSRPSSTFFGMRTSR